jgi:hypothetical protein
MMVLIYSIEKLGIGLGLRGAGCSFGVSVIRPGCGLGPPPYVSASVDVGWDIDVIFRSNASVLCSTFAPACHFTK